MTASPFNRGIKRLRRRSAHDHNKAVVHGDTPGNMEATPGNTPAVSPAEQALATPALIVVPGSPSWVDLATSLVAVAVWAVLTWRSRPGGPPVS